VLELDDEPRLGKLELRAGLLASLVFRFFRRACFDLQRVQVDLLCRHRSVDLERRYELAQLGGVVPDWLCRRDVQHLFRD